MACCVAGWQGNDFQSTKKLPVMTNRIQSTTQVDTVWLQKMLQNISKPIACNFFGALLTLIIHKAYFQGRCSWMTRKKSSQHKKTSNSSPAARPLARFRASCSSSPLMPQSAKTSGRKRFQLPRGRFFDPRRLQRLQVHIIWEDESKAFQQRLSHVLLGTALLTLKSFHKPFISSQGLLWFWK